MFLIIQSLLNCLISGIDNFSVYERGEYLAPEFFNKKVSDEIEVNYGVWCYMSKNCNINELYIYGWDRIDVSYISKYDLSNKGKWQYLEFTNKKFYNNFTLGVRMELLKQYEEMNGEVYITLPNYSIKNIVN